MKRATFERRHYQQIAECVRRISAFPHDEPREVIGDLIEEFCDCFARDNGNFQKATFKRACMSQDAARHLEVRR